MGHSLVFDERPTTSISECTLRTKVPPNAFLGYVSEKPHILSSERMIFTHQVTLHPHPLSVDRRAKVAPGCITLGRDPLGRDPLDATPWTRAKVKAPVLPSV